MQMKWILLLLISTFHFKVFAGAVSAGGMTAPAKVECLFVDPAQTLKPYNFIVYDLGLKENNSSIAKVDLETRTANFYQYFDQLAESSPSHGTVIYKNIKSCKKPQLKVVINFTLALTPEESARFVQPMTGFPKVNFALDVLTYPAKLSIDGENFQGICAKEYFFFYSVDEFK